MAGVASGLALATTLMAMQVADTMSARTCPYRAAEVAPAVPSDHGFLGIVYDPSQSPPRVLRVIGDSPAAAIGLRRGDRVVSVNGEKMDHPNELYETIFSSKPGSRADLTIEREGRRIQLRPTLASWPTISY